MDTSTAHMFQYQQDIAKQFGSEPLLALSNGTVISLATGYIPLLARFTFEDKAAKGLRKRKTNEKPEPTIHFSALELVCDNQFLLLTGPSGSGKTTFAKYLCFRLTSTDFDHGRQLVRNDFGDTREEKWNSSQLLPCYFALDNTHSLQKLVETTIPNIIRTASTEGTALLITIDAIDRAGDTAPHLLQQLFSLFHGHENHRLLLLGVPDICNHWILPFDIVRHHLLPFLESQIQQAVSKHLGSRSSEANIATGAAAKNPALFALALQAEHCGDQAEELLDSWLSIFFSQAGGAQILAENAYNRVRYDQPPRIPTKLSSTVATNNPVIFCNVIQNLLAAKHLAALPSYVAVGLFRLQPRAHAPIIQSCLGILSVNEREKAGRILSRLGDPRDLASLAEVPSGSFTMGSGSHPNSQPLNIMSLQSFRIGVYPVVSRDYFAFIRETDRDWIGPDGTDPDRSNVPATDLTWHDARAYCSWLTDRWRKIGKIGPDEQVRLPTEPEWERAAKGDYICTGSDTLVYPWGTTWEDQAANSETTGLNSTCAVGLFPKGCSPYGCYDMAGHVWEWCSTLWGEDMATPSFQYPWQDDDREAPDAPEQIRRVLRGGCFSSPKIKANSSYRGSLEPSGFWRGNGFRIVVAPVPK
ncbi:serine threonine-protein kinase [Colletotrichum incanum]|nr:serine threonine-protein kinase [Colletotrichum incanum]